MDDAVCLHNANVYTGFFRSRRTVRFISKGGKIADVYNEKKVSSKKVFFKVRIDLLGANVIPGFYGYAYSRQRRFQHR